MNQDYIFLIDKPSKMTSQDCLTIIKKKLKCNKIGHAGTLDPMATGILVVLVNQATKISDFLLSEDKTYQASIQLFVKTNTGDITGTVIDSSSSIISFSTKQVETAINHFNNLTYWQEIPLYSAKKINGKKLYQYAHQQKEVVLPKKAVNIKNIKLDKYADNLIEITVTCSKGTFVRTLASDIAQQLQTIGTLKSLKRISQSGFNINQCINFDAVTKDLVNRNQISIESALSQVMPIIKITDEFKLKRIKNGQPVVLSDSVKNMHVLFINDNQQPLAIYAFSENNNVFLSKRGFNDHENS